MTDEPTDARSPKGVEPDEDRVQTASNEILALSDDSDRAAYAGITVDQAAFLAVIAIYSKAFLEALARRHADGVTDLLNKHLRKTGKTTEVELSVDGGTSAIVVTRDLPDEARLALLDLDVTADEVRGKLLRWDSSASAWRPEDDQEIL